MSHSLTPAYPPSSNEPSTGGVRQGQRPSVPPIPVLGPGLRWRGALEVLRARRWWWLGLGVIGTVAAGVSAWQLPPSYRAEARLVLNTDQPDPLSEHSGWQPPPTTDSLSTALEVLRSNRVALEVIRQLPLATTPDVTRQSAWWLTPAVLQQAPGPLRERALAESLLTRLKVQPARDTQIVTLQFTAPVAADAARMANAFATAYQKVSLNLKTEPAQQQLAFFEAQADAARQTLNEQQLRLRAFEQQHGIVVASVGTGGGLGPDSSTEWATWREWRTRQATQETAAIDAESLRAQGDTARLLPEYSQHPTLASLQAELSRTDAQLNSLRARLGERHPEVQQAAAQREVWQNRLVEESVRLSASRAAQAEQQRLRGDALGQRVAQERQQVLRWQSLQERGQALVLAVAQARQRWEQLLARVQQAHLASASTLQPVHVLSVAVPPQHPVLDRRTVVLMASALMLVLALVSTWLLEMLDRRARLPEAAAAQLGLPLWAKVPTGRWNAAAPA